MLVFSPEWCTAWCAAINAEPAYAQAAAGWEGAVVLVAEGDGVARTGAWLDLHRGRCRAARPAAPADEAGARYVLTATPSVWKQVLTGALGPLMGVMLGKVRLAKGGLTELVPYAGAAKVMVEMAGRVPASFPPDWP
ncbi:MAG TPA: SCP2 sterol-binding domain-containing protein [Gemmatimonadales bacterium]|nr:SCP2 sterol-binding domain-containing protein [Gemmatimonadales bacterium]